MLIKLIKTKSSNDYSLIKLIFQFIEYICFIIYIFYKNYDIYIRIGTVIHFIIIIVVDFFILKYYKKCYNKFGE